MAPNLDESPPSLRINIIKSTASASPIKTSWLLKAGETRLREATQVPRRTSRGPDHPSPTRRMLKSNFRTGGESISSDILLISKVGITSSQVG